MNPQVKIKKTEKIQKTHYQSWLSWQKLSHGSLKLFVPSYNLNHEIADYPKCIISLIDGICMGGGAGLALHGDFTVVSNAVKFAMPEVFIGFFPDVGSGYIFNKLPRPTALWLLLTGARISGQMMHGLGLATHYIESRGIQALYKTLLQSDWRRSEAISILKSQLATYCEPPDSKQMPEGNYPERWTYDLGWGPSRA